MNSAALEPMEAPISETSAELDRIERDLTGLLAREPVGLLSASAQRRGADALVLVGVLGAKDVGKSTLINALACERVCEPEGEVDEGTRAAVAYVHAEDESALVRRLSAAGERAESVPVQGIARHRAERLRSLVLVDLPDFSSDMASHVEVARAAVRVLDRLVWVWDPLVTGDRAYAERLGRIARDARNVVRVLNKVDLLLRDQWEGEPSAEELWSQWREWFAGAAVAAGMESMPASDEIFMGSARDSDATGFEDRVLRDWGVSGPGEVESGALRLLRGIARRASDDLDRLRDALLGPMGESRVRLVKAWNSSAELASDRALLREHFGLDRLAGLAQSAGEAVREEVESAFDARWAGVVSRRLAARSADELELAHEVMARRLEGWPILPVIYWPIRSVVRAAGRRLSGLRPASGSAARAAKGPMEEVCRVDGVAVQERLMAAQSRSRIRLGELLAALRDPPRWPEPEHAAERVTARLEEAGEGAAAEVVALCTAGRRRPGLLRRSLAWLVLVWFVLLQPVGHGVLLLLAASAPSGGAQAWSSPGLATALHGAAVVVGALGATSLLLGLGVSILVYLAILAGMYSRSLRDVRRARSEGDDPADGRAGLYAAAVARVVEGEVLRPLAEPLNRIAAEISRLQAALGGTREAEGEDTT